MCLCYGTCYTLCVSMWACVLHVYYVYVVLCVMYMYCAYCMRACMHCSPVLEWLLIWGVGVKLVWAFLCESYELAATFLLVECLGCANIPAESQETSQGSKGLPPAPGQELQSRRAQHFLSQPLLAGGPAHPVLPPFSAVLFRLECYHTEVWVALMANWAEHILYTYRVVYSFYRAYLMV